MPFGGGGGGSYDVQRPRKHLEMRGTDQKGHLSFAILFHENRAISFPKSGTFPQVQKVGEGHLLPMPPPPPVPRPRNMVHTLSR